MRTYRYLRYHVKTGQRSESTFEAVTRMDALETVNRWNYLGYGEWQYVLENEI